MFTLGGNPSTISCLVTTGGRRRDADNCLKCLQDSLVHAGALRDDSQIKVLHVEMLEPVPDGRAYILLERKEEYDRRKQGLPPVAD